MDVTLAVISLAPTVEDRKHGKPMSGGVEYMWQQADVDAPVHYLLPDHTYEKLSLPKLMNMEDEIKEGIERLKSLRVNCVFMHGTEVLWCLTGQSSIKNYRGYVMETRLGIKGIASHDLQTVQRDYSLLPIFIADLHKAMAVSRYAELRRPRRTVYVAESVEDCWDWSRDHVSDVLCLDVETEANQINSISFSHTPQESLVLTIFEGRKEYWSPEEEVKLWLFIRHMVERCKVLVGQNITYDLAHLARHGIIPRCRVEDTMLMHHALQPEMDKGLGFLASLHAHPNEMPWKNMRTKSLAEINKAGE